MSECESLLSYKAVEEYWESHLEEYDRIYSRFLDLMTPIIEESYEVYIQKHNLNLDSSSQTKMEFLNFNAAWMAYQIGWIEGKLNS